MGDRKWEDLPVDCLVDIFGRVGLESLVDGVPYVCKSWYKATLSPLCWRSLIIYPYNLPRNLWHLEQGLGDADGIDEHAEWQTFSSELVEAFVKFVIHRSHGSATVFVLRDGFFLTEKLLNLVAEGCPSLKKLVLPWARFEMPMLPNLICKWKDLEALQIDQGYLVEEILSQISLHCKNFKSLGVIDVYIGESRASAIASHLPNLEFLCLKDSRIERSNLVMILKGCKKLVRLEVGYCLGFDVDDEVLNLAAHIAGVNFMVRSSSCTTY